LHSDIHGATKESTLTAESFRKYGLGYFLGPGGKFFMTGKEANAGIPTKNGVVVTRNPVALGFLKKLQSLDDPFIGVVV
jgi:hypothetical protein